MVEWDQNLHSGSDDVSDMPDKMVQFALAKCAVQIVSMDEFTNVDCAKTRAAAALLKAAFRKYPQILKNLNYIINPPPF